MYGVQLSGDRKKLPASAKIALKGDLAKRAFSRVEVNHNYLFLSQEIEKKKILPYKGKRLLEAYRRHISYMICESLYGKPLTVLLFDRFLETFENELPWEEYAGATHLNLREFSDEIMSYANFAVKVQAWDYLMCEHGGRVIFEFNLLHLPVKLLAGKQRSNVSDSQLQDQISFYIKEGLTPINEYKNRSFEINILERKQLGWEVEL